MTQFPTQTPQNAGFDPDRLAALGPFFQSYLDSGRLPNVGMAVMRHGHIVYEHWAGKSAFDDGFVPDQHSLYRIYSMTKPITSVGLMMLYEQGKFQLHDPVSKFIPAFSDLKVFESGTPREFTTCAPEREMTIHDLLTHQSGLTYDFMMETPVDALYRNAKINGARSEKYALDEFVDRLCDLPLLFSPGTRWNYSVSTDVCGRLIEIISGKSLDRYFYDHILGPLGMADTSFTLAEDQLGRLVNNYNRDPLSSKITLADSADKTVYRPGRKFLSGGGGLISSMHDYLRFCLFLHQGGTLDGQRLLSPSTVAFMTSNHLPDNETLATCASGSFSEVSYQGIGFGLGFSVVADARMTPTVSYHGNYSWGGLANTFFWNDPLNELSVVFFTQMMPSGAYPVRPQLQQLVYAALVDPAAPITGSAT